MKIGYALVAKTTPFSIAPPNSTKKILVLGDSLAVGVGATKPEDSMAGLISHDYPTASIINLAKSGSRTEDILGQLTKVKNQKFDLIIIQIGGNDVTHFTNQKEITNNMKQIISQAKTMAPHILVWSSGSVGFAPIFVPPLSWILTERTGKTYENIAKTVETEGATYINLYVPYQEDIFKTDIKKYYAEDNFHVASAAYRVWYEKCRPKIKEFLDS